jgi:hypothetical protein
MARSNDLVVPLSLSPCSLLRKGYPLKVEWALAVLGGHPVIAEERKAPRLRAAIQERQVGPALVQ